MADDSDDSQKTEEPTGKRLDEAHDQGQFAITRELQNWLLIVCCLIIVNFWMPTSFLNLEHDLRNYIEHSHDIYLDQNNSVNITKNVVIDIVYAISIPAILLILFAVIGTIIQTGGRVSWEPLKPSFGGLNPLANLKNIFSTSQLAELLKNIVKLVAIFYITYYALYPMYDQIENYQHIDLSLFLGNIKYLTNRLLTYLLVILTLITVADYVFQYFQFMKKMRMTKQEVKDEFKQSEGDPVVKGRLRQIRMEKARHRMMSNVPKSDVVITNPTHYAVALKYDPAINNAPILLAKGVDTVAFNIRKLAEEHNIPIIQNPPVARSLYATVEIDQEIRPEDYKAVAEIITYVYKLKNR